MREQDGALVAERRVNDLAFLVADRRPRPFREEGAVVVEHAVSMWATISGWPIIDSAEQYGGWVCTIAFTCGRCL